MHDTKLPLTLTFIIINYVFNSRFEPAFSELVISWYIFFFISLQKLKTSMTIIITIIIVINRIVQFIILVAVLIISCIGKHIYRELPAMAIIRNRQCPYTNTRTTASQQGYTVTSSITVIRTASTTGTHQCDTAYHQQPSALEGMGGSVCVSLLLTLSFFLYHISPNSPEEGVGNAWISIYYTWLLEWGHHRFHHPISNHES